MGEGKKYRDPSTRTKIPHEPNDDPDASALNPRVQELLGKVFRSYCDDLLNQPIPDKFVVLLARLEAKQREKK